MEGRNNMDNENPAIADEIARRCVSICEEKKASNILLFDVRENSILADYFLVCCGNSMAHVRALSENLRRTLVNEGFKPRGREGTPASQWIVLDFGIILIHIMTPEMRRHYCLEDLWDKRLVVYQGGEEMPSVSNPADGDEHSTYEGQWDDDFDEDDEEEDDWDDEDIDDEDIDDEDDEDIDDEDDEDWDENDEDDGEDAEDWDDVEEDAEDWEEEDDNWDDDDDDDEEEEGPKPKKDGGITPKDIFGDDDDDKDDAIKIPVNKG